MSTKKSLQKLAEKEVWESFKKRTLKFVTVTECSRKHGGIRILNYGEEVIGYPSHILLDLVPTALEGKCLGILQCTINYVGGNTERINFVGISGIGGRGTLKCLSQVKNLIQDNTIVAIVSDVSIYGPLKGTTIVWAAEFLNEIRLRLPRYFRKVLEHLRRQNVDFNNSPALSDALLSYHDNDAMSYRLTIGENLDIYTRFVSRLYLQEDTTIRNLLFCILCPPKTVLLENWYRGDEAMLQLDLNHLAQFASGNLMDEARNRAKRFHRVLGTPVCLVSEKMKESVTDMGAALMAAVSPAEDPTTNSALADVFVQCAEDAATGALVNYLEGKQPIRIVATWTSTTSSSIAGCKLVHKPLCPFCESRFAQRFCDVVDALCE